MAAQPAATDKAARHTTRSPSLLSWTSISVKSPTGSLQPASPTSPVKP